MDELRFKILLDAYGADIERWPAAEREEGRRRLAAAGGSERALLDENAALDALLRAPRPQQASSALIGRIMAEAPSEPRAAGVFGGAIALLGLNRQARFAAAGLVLLSAGALAGWSASQDVLGSAAGDALLAASYSETADELFLVEEF